MGLYCICVNNIGSGTEVCVLPISKGCNCTFRVSALPVPVHRIGQYSEYTGSLYRYSTKSTKITSFPTVPLYFVFILPDQWVVGRLEYHVHWRYPDHPDSRCHVVPDAAVLVENHETMLLDQCSSISVI